ncbi:Hypothetical predicted protein [Olea europaea subsp. europaea]|uniref:Glycine-rich protein n=1 Tax=Olea europaea subsp. europaea TaxID=158383 RepID=A0A8S0TZD6_OLEEU|nr:Hypothetical predicted protein [Olea europaea subsp. europaea]
MTSKLVLLVFLGVLVCTTAARKLVVAEGPLNDQLFFHHWSSGEGGLSGGGGFGDTAVGGAGFGGGGGFGGGSWSNSEWLWFLRRILWWVWGWY